MISRNCDHACPDALIGGPLGCMACKEKTTVNACVPAWKKLETNMRCTSCGAPRGKCDCWRVCNACGQTHHKDDGPCRYRHLAEAATSELLHEMRFQYPEPMRHASGGFAKTLRVNAERIIRGVIRETLTTGDLNS